MCIMTFRPQRSGPRRVTTQLWGVNSSRAFHTHRAVCAIFSTAVKVSDRDDTKPFLSFILRAALFPRFFSLHYYSGINVLTLTVRLLAARDAIALVHLPFCTCLAHVHAPPPCPNISSPCRSPIMPTRQSEACHSFVLFRVEDAG